MLDIRRVLQIFLQMVSCLQSAVSESGGLSELEEEVASVTRTAAHRLLEHALEAKDKQLADERNKAQWELVSRKQRTVVTTVGELTFWRRYYKDKRTGERCFLLDDRLGLGQRERVSPLLRKKAVMLATEMSYGRVAKVLQEFMPDISPMAIWEEVQRVGAAQRRRAEGCRAEVFERGQTPPGKRRVDTLHVEADGVFVRARDRQGQRRHIEVKLAVAYEGKREMGPGRRELLERRIVAGVAEGPVFWEEAVAQFGRTWDWGSVSECWLGTDGAAWAKQGVEMLPGAKHRLDVFHLRKALLGALRREDAAYREVCAAMAEEDWERVERALTEVERRSQGPAKERVRQLKGYLRHNWDGIVGTGAAASLGTIEGQVFHHVARRMKRHGARWSATGADHLVRLLVARANGEMLSATKEAANPLAAAKRPSFKVPNGTEVQRKLRAAEEWLQVHMPALQGPHAGRPWVKHVLRELARSPHTVA
ncbi:MAG: ISLre2 family transposase [Alicyclobacillus sp.]|nr:ISLre2 family transposase [Alicyclobacillus sp.]